MLNEPVLSKHPDDPERDYKPMTWERFLLLRAWAKWIAWREKCAVALVGSVLYKPIPRDIDVALIWPEEEFVAKFGPRSTSGRNLLHNRDLEDKRHSLYVSAQELVKFDTRIDIRLCPDCWWPEKDRLILATPSDTEPPNSYNGVEFVVRKVLRKGDPGWDEEFGQE